MYRLLHWLCAFTVLSVASAQAPRTSWLSVDGDPDSDGPIALAWTLDGSAILVAHAHTGDVTFVEPAVGRATDRVATGGTPTEVVLTPDGRYGLVTLRDLDALGVIDVASRTLVATVPLTGTGPYRVEPSSDSSFAVVAIEGSGPGTSRVSVVDLASLAEAFSFGTEDQAPYVVADSALESYLGERYPRMDLAPDDTTLLLPTAPTYAVRAYDVTSGALVNTLTLPAGLAVSIQVEPQGTYAALLYVDAVLHGFWEVARLDLPSFTSTTLQWELMAGVPTEEGLAMTSDGLTCVVTTQREGSGQDTYVVGMFGGGWSAGQVGGHAVALTRDDRFAVVVGVPSSSPWYYPTNAALIDLVTGTIAERRVLGVGLALATSPTNGRVAMLRSFEDEDVEVLDVGGGRITRRGPIATGLPVEGDHPVDLALDSTGALGVVANLYSDDLVRLDLEAGAVLARIPLPDRPRFVEIDAAGTTGVVAHAGGSVSVVDLPGAQVLATLPTPAPVEIEVSFELDRVWVLGDDGTLTTLVIDGASSHVLGQFDVGGNGWSWVGRLAARSDGRVAVSRGYLEEALLVDGLTGSILTTFDTEEGFARGLYLTDGDLAWTTSLTHLVRYDISGLPHMTGTVELDVPRFVQFDSSAGFAYTTTGSQNPRLLVVDTAAMSKVAELPLPSSPVALALSPPLLFAALEDGSLLVFEADGPATAQLSSHPLTGVPADLVAIAEQGLVAAVQPGARDGLDLLDFTIEERYCGPANSNSSGASAEIDVKGWTLAGRPMTLVATQMPTGHFGAFLISNAAGFVPFVGGSDGNLCLSSTIERFPTVLHTGVEGSFALDVDTSAIPWGGGTLAVQPGETWYFQGWFRDANPATTSNLTDGVALTFS